MRRVSFSELTYTAEGACQSHTYRKGSRLFQAFYITHVPPMIVEWLVDVGGWYAVPIDVYVI